MSSCKTCQFFNQSTGYFENNQIGVCKRYPPIARPYDPNSVNASLAVFPVVREAEFCGEFKPLEHVIL